MPALVTAPLSADGDLPLPADTWVMDAGAWVSEEHAPTNPLHEPSVFNDLSSGAGFWGFFFPPLSRQENFQYCAWWFHVTNPLSWLLILLAIFLTTLYRL